MNTKVTTHKDKKGKVRVSFKFSPAKGRKVKKNKVVETLLGTECGFDELDRVDSFVVEHLK